MATQGNPSSKQTPTTVKSVTCASCHELFDTDWTDEEASLEFANIFPGHDIRNADVVCDDCWVKMGFGDSTKVNDMAAQDQQASTKPVKSAIRSKEQ